MKRIVFSLIAIMAFCFTSCQFSNVDRLTLRKAQQLFDQEIKKDKATTLSCMIETGYYECNNEAERNKLRALAANNIINYSCERLARPTPYGKDIAHFVTVSLTVTGENLIYEEQLTQDQIDLQWKAKNHDEYPEAKVSEIEFPDEHQEKAQKRQAVPSVQPAALDSLFVMVDSNKAPVIDTMAVYLYDQACKKVKKDTVTLFAGEIKSIKARNVETYKIDSCNAMALGQIVYKLTNVSPVGRIYLNLEEGKKGWAPRMFVYNDKTGWMIYSEATSALFNLRFEEHVNSLDNGGSYVNEIKEKLQKELLQRLSTEKQQAERESYANVAINSVSAKEVADAQAVENNPEWDEYREPVVDIEAYEEQLAEAAETYEVVDTAVAIEVEWDID